MIYFIDLDGVVADLVTPWCGYIRKELDVDITHETVNHYDTTKAALERGCKRSPSETKRIVNRFIEIPGTFAKLEPYPLAVETIRRMFDLGRDVRIATAPWRASSAGEKIEWVRDRISTKIPVILLHDKSVLSPTGGVLIDDCPKHFEPWGSRGWMMDRPWNQGAPAGRRVTWEQIAAELWRSGCEYCGRTKDDHPCHMMGCPGIEPELHKA